MKKALGTLLGALLLVLAPLGESDGATKRLTGCIQRIFFNLGATPGRALVAVVVGEGVFYFHQDGMEHGRTASLSYSQVAAFEPFLASIRAGAQARVQAFVDWDETTKRVMHFEVLFDRPCQ